MKGEAHISHQFQVWHLATTAKIPPNWRVLWPELNSSINPTHVLQRLPLALIREHFHTTGFALASESTPYGQLEGDPPLEYPLASPSREAPSAFMASLTQLMHFRSEAPHTLLCSEGLALFRVPYPVANPPTAPTTFIHSPIPHPIVVDHLLTSTTRRLTPAEEEYLHTFQVAPPMTQEAPPVPEHQFQATPHLRPAYIPPWSAVQSGPLPPMPPAQQHLLHPCLCLPHWL